MTRHRWILMVALLCAASVAPAPSGAQSGIVATASGTPVSQSKSPLAWRMR